MRIAESIPLVIAIGLAAIASSCERSPSLHSESPPGEARATASAAGFVASRNGFPFRNSFPGAPLPSFMNASGKGQSAYGLCGGMSAAAADYFLGGRVPARSTGLPARGSPLYEYFYLRQAESLGPGLTTALKFAALTAKTDREVGEASRGEVNALEVTLQSRSVTPLGLILARTGGPAGANRVDQNHQVLALGVRREGERVLIRVYDPNYPSDDGIVIDLDFTTNAGPIGLHRRSNGRTCPVRGVLLVPYSPRTPPLNAG